MGMEDFKRFAEVSEKAFRNRANEAGKRASALIEGGQDFAAADAIAEAIRYDGIAKEYEFLIDAEVWE